MASGNSWTGARSAPFATPSTALPPRFDLRPLSTGEVLDRTFQIYRSRFTLFAGLAMLPAAVSVVTQAVRLWYDAHQRVHAHHGADLYRVQAITIGLSLVSAVISLILYGITQAATTWAVSAVYLGEPADIQTAYATAARHWVRYTFIVLRQVWAFIYAPTILFVAAALVLVSIRKNPGAATSLRLVGSALILVGCVSLLYAFWAYIRLSLAVPAAVVESLKVRASLKRSIWLLSDRKVRILLLFLFLFALYLVIGAIQAPLAYFAIRARGTEAFVTHAISLVISFVTGTLVGPLGAIAICLFYIDERVRREGFDIEWMMTRLAPAPPPDTIALPPSEPTPTPE